MLSPFPHARIIAAPVATAGAYLPREGTKRAGSPITAVVAGGCHHGHIEFVTDQARVLLAFVEGVSRHGHVPSVAEFDAFAAKPQRQEAVPLGKLLRGGLVTQFFEGVAAASEPCETALKWLDRLHWVRIERQTPERIAREDRVRITQLGKAVLAAAREGSADEQAPTHVVLDHGDPIARARVMERLAGIGDFALVDRYFSADDFLGVLQRTQVSRVLTGPDETRGRLAGLREAVDAVTPPRAFELRIDKDDQIHDRYAIAESGSVLAIGTSLSGVGKRHSVMVELGDGAVAQSIRGTFETRWAQAEPVKPKALEKATNGTEHRRPVESADNPRGADAPERRGD